MICQSPGTRAEAADLLITGTGSLATAVLLTLATRLGTAGPKRLDVVIASRDWVRASTLADIAAARANVACGAAHFSATAIDWEAREGLADLLARLYSRRSSYTPRRGSRRGRWLVPMLGLIW